MRSAVSLVLVACILSGCSDREPVMNVAARDPQPPRTRILPPTGAVRPLPPHAIRADGVGPYKLGDKLTSLLQQLPAGPKIVRFEVPGIARTHLIRAEDDTVLIGGEASSTATFVAVVGSEVARTESGVHVGSTSAELVRALGPLVDDVEQARDPRLAVTRGLHNVRVVLENARIIAFVVTSEAAPARTPDDTCPRPASTETAFGACLTGTGELVEVAGGELVIRSAGTEKPIATLRIPNLVFAAPLRNVAEGRDELVAITRADNEPFRMWSMVAYRMEGGRAIRAVDPSLLYQLSSAQTRWIGADLHDVDLYLELTSRADGIEVGGLLTTRVGDKVRDVAVIASRLVDRRHGKVAPAADGGAGAGPSGSGAKASPSGSSSGTAGTSRPAAPVDATNESNDDSRVGGSASH